MKRVLWCSLVILFVVGPTEMANARDKRERTDQADEAAYGGTATVRGLVTILNHPSLGATAASSTFLVFQRADCNKKAYFGVWTDVNGRFEIHVGPGRYRLIVREGTRTGDTRSMIAPGQAQVINVPAPGTTTDFNVKLLLP